jgi:hypothetical protein
VIMVLSDWYKSLDRQGIPPLRQEAQETQLIFRILSHFAQLISVQRVFLQCTSSHICLDSHRHTDVWRGHCTSPFGVVAAELVLQEEVSNEACADALVVSSCQNP